MFTILLSSSSAISSTRPLQKYYQLSSFFQVYFVANAFQFINMKFIVASVAALASVAIAAPGAETSGQCKPATYRCEPGKEAWDVCNTAGQWVVSILFASDWTRLVILIVHVLVCWQLPTKNRLQVLPAKRQPLLRPPRLHDPLSVAH